MIAVEKKNTSEMDGKKKAKSLTITNSESFWKSSKYLVITVEK